MKAVINCRRDNLDWQREYFADIPPYMLPFLGKPLIEFYFDWCSLSGISEILLVVSEYEEAANRFIGNGSRWGLSVKIVAMPSNPDMNTILSHYPNFADAKDCVFLDGFFFPYYDKNAEKTYSTSIDSNFVKFGSDARVCKCEFIDVDSLRAYYDLNMKLLKEGTSQMTMKGYGVETDVFIGMNDTIMKHAKLVPPFIVGDNSQIEEFTQVGANTIIGDTCIVDRRTTLTNTMVLDSTYVGADLVLDGKILMGAKIIDPYEGVQVSFSDNSFSSKLDADFAKRLLVYAIQAPLAIVFELLLAIPYIAFLITGIERHKNIRVPVSGGTVKVPVYRKEKTLKNMWFFKLSLDKFVPLQKVISGRLLLIGDTCRDASNPELLTRYKRYRAGVFTYADSLCHYDEYETIIDDLFYKHNGTVKTDMQLILRSFVSRLLWGNRP